MYTRVREVRIHEICIHVFQEYIIHIIHINFSEDNNSTTVWFEQREKILEEYKELLGTTLTKIHVT